MKTVSFLSRLAGLAFAAFLVALAFDAAALTWFACSACSLVVLTAASDYAPRRPYAQPTLAPVLRFPQPKRATSDHSRAPLAA